MATEDETEAAAGDVTEAADGAGAEADDLCLRKRCNFARKKLVAELTSSICLLVVFF